MPSGRILPVRSRYMAKSKILLLLLLLSCGGPVPVKEQEDCTIVKADTIYYSDGSWVSGEHLFYSSKSPAVFRPWPFWIGILTIVAGSVAGLFALGRRYRRKLYEREAAESQAVLALLQDRVHLVKSLAETHEKTVLQNRAVSYHDQLEALQETVRRYHDYLGQLRTDQSFMQNLESALDAGMGKVMTKARHLLGTSISTEDYRVLALYLAGMKPSSISFVTGISPGTLRTKKSRIKGRLEKCTPSRDRDFILRRLTQN